MAGERVVVQVMTGIEVTMGMTVVVASGEVVNDNQTYFISLTRVGGRLGVKSTHRSIYTGCVTICVRFLYWIGTLKGSDVQGIDR